MSDKEPPRQAPFPALDSCLGWLSAGEAAQSHGPALGPPPPGCLSHLEPA